MWESPAGLSQAVAGIHAFHGFPQLRHFQSGLAATFDLQDPDILALQQNLWAKIDAIKAYGKVEKPRQRASKLSHFPTGPAELSLLKE